MNGMKNIKITLVEAGATSAGTELTSDSVDMEGFDGVMFVGKIATVNAGNYGKAAQSSDDGVADAFSDIEGSKVVPGDDGDSFLIDVYKPQKRYVRCAVIRAGANTVTGDVYAIQYGPAKPPVTQGTTIDSELHISPAEGTA